MHSAALIFLALLGAHPGAPVAVDSLDALPCQGKDALAREIVRRCTAELAGRPDRRIEVSGRKERIRARMFDDAGQLLFEEQLPRITSADCPAFPGALAVLVRSWLLRETPPPPASLPAPLEASPSPSPEPRSAHWLALFALGAVTDFDRTGPLAMLAVETDRHPLWGLGLHARLEAPGDRTGARYRLTPALSLFVGTGVTSGGAPPFSRPQLLLLMGAGS